MSNNENSNYVYFSQFRFLCSVDVGVIFDKWFFGNIRTIVGNFHLLQYLSGDLALYFYFKKGSDKPSNKFTIPTAAINSSTVFRWFGQHAFTIVFALEINRSVTYESQFLCRFTFCTVWIIVFCLLLFSAWHTRPILPFWTMLCVCTSEEMNLSAFT